MKIGTQFVKDLNRALNLRRVAEGVAMLDKAEPTWARLLPRAAHATELLLLLGQWVDVGYREYHLLDPILA